MRFRRSNPAAAMILNGLVLPEADIYTDSMSFTTGQNYTFTAYCNAPDLTYSWTPGSGVTIVSGSGTDQIVVSFSTIGFKTIQLEVTNPKGLTKNAAWIGTVV